MHAWKEIYVIGDWEAMVDFSYLHRVCWFYYSMWMEKGNKQKCTIVVDAYRTYFWRLPFSLYAEGEFIHSHER